jgi:hypothetical protein
MREPAGRHTKGGIMGKFNVSEKTAALLPELIIKAGITNPIVGMDETKTLIRIYLLGNPEPVVIRKRSPDAKRRTKPPATPQAKGKKNPPQYSTTKP